MKLPVIFHPKYDIGLFGLENRHPFDSKKYGKVFQFLKEKGILTDENYHQPEAMVTDKQLLTVHTPAYLRKIHQSSVVAGIAEMQVLRYVPNCILQRNFLNPMRWATAGTILAADLALEHG
jgi:histone deacetylase 11